VKEETRAQLPRGKKLSKIFNFVEYPREKRMS
jgi:hypothetical protein